MKNKNQKSKTEIEKKKKYDEKKKKKLQPIKKYKAEKIDEIIAEKNCRKKKFKKYEILSGKKSEY